MSESERDRIEARCKVLMHVIAEQLDGEDFVLITTGGVGGQPTMLSSLMPDDMEALMLELLVRLKIAENREEATNYVDMLAAPDTRQ